MKKVLVATAAVLAALAAIATIGSFVYPLLKEVGALAQVPDVFEQDAPYAKSRLLAFGFKVDELSENSELVVKGKVIRTKPPGNTTVRSGATINMYVSLGPPGPGAGVSRALLTRKQIEKVVSDQLFNLNGSSELKGSSEEPLKRLAPLQLCLVTSAESFDATQPVVWGIYVGASGGIAATTVGSEAFALASADANQYFDSLSRMARACQFSLQTPSFTFVQIRPQDALAFSHPVPDSSGAYTDYVVVRLGNVVAETVVVSSSDQHSKYALTLAGRLLQNMTVFAP